MNMEPSNSAWVMPTATMRGSVSEQVQAKPGARVQHARVVCPYLCSSHAHVPWRTAVPTARSPASTPPLRPPAADTDWPSAAPEYGAHAI